MCLWKGMWKTLGEHLWIAANVTGHCFTKGAVPEDDILLAGYFGHDFYHIQACVVGQFWGDTLHNKPHNGDNKISSITWALHVFAYLKILQGPHSHWRHRLRSFHPAMSPRSTPLVPEEPFEAWLRTGICKKHTGQVFHDSASIQKHA